MELSWNQFEQVRHNQQVRDVVNSMKRGTGLGVFQTTQLVSQLLRQAQLEVCREETNRILRKRHGLSH